MDTEEQAGLALMQERARERFQAYIRAGVDSNHVEAEIIKRLYEVLEAAGDPVVEVFDGEETTAVSTLWEVYEQAFNLDMLDLYTESGGWIRLVMGEEWDTLADYTLSIEEAIKPVNDWIMQNY